MSLFEISWRHCKKEKRTEEILRVSGNIFLFFSLKFVFHHQAITKPWISLKDLSSFQFRSHENEHKLVFLTSLLFLFQFRFTSIAANFYKLCNGALKLKRQTNLCIHLSMTKRRLVMKEMERASIGHKTFRILLLSNCHCSFVLK